MSEKIGSKESSAKSKDVSIPASLTEFLLAHKPSARRFVQYLSKGVGVTDEDLSRARDILEKQPEKLGRVVELTRAAADAVPQSSVLLRWCEEILRSRDSKLRDWALDPTQDAVSAFRDLLLWALPTINAKVDRPMRQQAEACLLIGLSLLIARRSLPSIHVLRTMASAIGVERERRSIASVERRVRRKINRMGVKQLAELSEVAVLSHDEVVSAENALQAANRMVENLRDKKSTLENELGLLSKQVQKLDQELGRRDDRVQELVTDLEAVRTRASDDLVKLKARIRREFGDKLAGLLADAWDALDTDPPHPGVARERVEMAREAIQREVEWLNKSSD